MSLRPLRTLHRLKPWCRAVVEVASQEPPAQSFEQDRLPSQLRQWITPGAELYVNPICSQMDQMLLKCEQPEAVLALLVTHRGVFFVHNLVTAIQVLASLDEVKDPIALNRLLRDPRYDLLLRDLVRFVPKLDFQAMTHIVHCLQQLDHKYYALFSRMLRPLMQQPCPDVSILLRCLQAYCWAGYHQQSHFFGHFANLMTDADLELEQLVEGVVLFSGTAEYQEKFFHTAEQRLLRDLPLLSPHQASLVALAFTAHLHSHDQLLEAVAGLVQLQAMSMEPADIVRCLQAFHRAVLFFPDAVRAGLDACSVPLYRAWLLRTPCPALAPTDVAELLESAAFFGIPTDLTRVALEYLADHVDAVPERAAIQTVYAMCMTGAVANHSKLLLYLFRKIGAGTAWEAQRVRVFQIWMSQLLQFPWLDARLKKRCIETGMRAWCLHRGGFGCPHPEEVREVSEELKSMGVAHQSFVHVKDTPYELDVVIGDRKAALLVSSETARNTLTPVGGTLLQIKHLQDRGWRLLVIPRVAWRRLPAVSRARYLSLLLDGLASSQQSLSASEVTRLPDPSWEE
ncbi:unnamed protein product [Effrenium voratum]|uniref:RAP domain-containing protein n=2 Tax=Effrenium voratum TaxID=2562239 RepID=A0AA36MKA3_9DINO|nr:unnamed protein product [Effrenium voratum]